MEARLASQLPKISELCDRYGVAHLELFGSAASGNFVPATSDYDFLVELDDTSPGSKALRCIELAEQLEKLLGRHVDLVSPRYIENPIFRREIDSSRVTIYDRKSAQASA